MKGGNGKLPHGAMRIATLVERSAPDQTRPRLSDEWEQQLIPVDVASAACYASMEDLSDRLARLAVAIDSELDGVVVDKAGDEDSLVVHLNEVQARLTTPDRLPVAPNPGNGSLALNTAASRSTGK